MSTDPLKTIVHWSLLGKLSEVSFVDLKPFVYLKVLHRFTEKEGMAQILGPPGQF